MREGEGGEGEEGGREKEGEGDQWKSLEVFILLRW